MLSFINDYLSHLIKSGNSHIESMISQTIIRICETFKEEKGEHNRK